jgi:hypothetical protein
MSRIFASVKEDSLRQSIERAAAAVQSEVVTREFYNLDKNSLRAILEESTAFINSNITQEVSSKSSFLEKNLKNQDKSAFLTR